MYLSDNEVLNLDAVKILRIGQSSGRTPLNTVFDALSDAYCSLGQDSSYYQRLLTVAPAIRDEYLTGLRDVAASPLEVRARLSSEAGFRESLLRNGSGVMEEGVALLQTDEQQAAPSDDVESAEQDSESETAEIDPRIRDAVELVPAATSRDVKLRAIQQARDVLIEWTDYDDEHRLFATVIDVGLTELAAFVRDERPDRTPETILSNLRQNIDQAIDWANGNRYFRFAGTLAGLIPLLQGIAN